MASNKTLPSLTVERMTWYERWPELLTREQYEQKNDFRVSSLPFLNVRLRGGGLSILEKMDASIGF